MYSQVCWHPKPIISFNSSKLTTKPRTQLVNKTINTVGYFSKRNSLIQFISEDMIFFYFSDMFFDKAIYTHRKWVLLDTAYVNKNLFLCCHFMINFLYA